MSDFDQKDIVEEVTPSGSDFDPADVVSEPQEPQQDSLLNTLVAKTAEGGSLGFVDEIGGGLSALGRVAGVENLGGRIKDIGLAEGGPTLDLETLLNSYRNTRDSQRQMLDKMQADRPVTSTLANVAGGIAAPLPKALTAPLGQAAKGAPLLTRMAMGAGNAIPTAAIASAGLSQADMTQGQSPLGDISQGAGLGAIIGGGLPLVGTGLRGGANLAGSMVPETVKDAYQAGKQGINIAGQEFYDSVTDQVRKLTGKVSDPILKKAEAQRAANAKIIGETDKQITQLTDDAAYALDLSKQKQVAQTADDVANLNKETVDVAQRLQKQVLDVEKALGKQFDEIDRAAGATGVTPDFKEVIGNTLQNLELNSSLPQDKILSIQKKLAGFMDKKDPQSYRDLKATISSYFENSDPVVRRTMKQAYGQLKNNYSNDLRANGYNELADRMSETNKRWMAKLDLEDQFLGAIKPDRVTGQVEATPKAIQTVSSFAEKNPGQIAKSQEFSNMMNVLQPKPQPVPLSVSPGQSAMMTPANPTGQILSQMDDLAAQQAQAKAASPLQLPVGQNPEIDRLKDILAKAKGENPDQIPGLNLPTDPASLEAKLTNLLPKQGQRTGENVVENQLDDVMNFLRQEKGDEFVNATQDEIASVNKNLAMRDAVNTPKGLNLKKAGVGATAGGVLGFGVGGPLGAGIGSGLGALGGAVADKAVGGATGLANKAGQAVRDNTALLKKGVQVLSDASPQALTSAAQKMAQTGGEVGKKFAGVLMDASEKNSQSKNAMIFGLMQQPMFRELFRGTIVDSTDEQE